MINKIKKNPRVVIIIPARLESKRLKRKLLRKISGKQMIIRVAETAERLKLAEVFVATDSSEIFNLCRKHAIKAFMSIEEHKSGTDRIFEAYKGIHKKFDIIINLQGDLPLFKKELIENIINLFRDQKVDIGSAVCDLEKQEISDKNIVKAQVNIIKNEGYAIDFKRKVKSLKDQYHHIGIYAFRPNILEQIIGLEQTKNEITRKLEQMRALDNGYKIKVFKINYNPPSVDTVDDLMKIRLIFRKNNFKPFV